jgi:5-methylcytosine-specific restriction enzyme A
LAWCAFLIERKRAEGRAALPVQLCKGRAGCPNLVQRGVCDDCREKGFAKENRPNAAQRGYGGKWPSYSRGFLKRNRLCKGLRVEIGGAVVINTHPGRVVPSVATDHIIPVEGQSDPLFWDEDNHQPACKSCHSVKTAKEDGGFGRKNASSQRGARLSAH